MLTPVLVTTRSTTVSLLSVLTPAQRADAVVKALKDAGIAADRITFDSKGARVQPFADNDSNRVSIVIAE